MTDLYTLINECPLYRQIFSSAHFRRPAVIYCTKKEKAAALEWYKDSTGRTPEKVVLFDRDACPGTRAMLFAKWSTRPEVLFIVFGKYGRRKGLDLALAGIRNFVFDRDQMYSQSRFDPSYLKAFGPRLEWLFSLLEDEESRWTLASVIKHRITGDHGYLRIATYPEYEHPQVHAELGDVVYDVGSFDGTTSFRFAEMVGHSGKVYAFEPDPSNADRIKARADELKNRGGGVGTVEVVMKAASSTDGKLRFSGGAKGSSRLSDDGDIEVDCTTLDTFSKLGQNTPPNLVSLDVEGAEPHVIEGARRLINRHSPKLQISAYHLPEHLVSLAELAWNTGKYRKMYMGHHNTYSTETDLYFHP